MTLFWPETGEYGPIQGLREGEEIGPLADDRRVLAYRKGGDELWLLDPETGERTAVSTGGQALEGIRGLSGLQSMMSCTPSGAPVIFLSTEGGCCLGRMDKGALARTAVVGKAIPVILALPDEDTALVATGDRTIERLRFGDATRERLFPR